ncbi:PAS domain-containing protein [Tropicimonas sp. IMCC34011]|uniref:PAS domain-containing protein n=1 Tax=Tropicimonas sp. IMCC34011 TaxID=2248759 RepID=UPI001E3B2F9E|nr:PAS domain-containing protein [Tropicimonas sp. IMCC34011]
MTTRDETRNGQDAKIVSLNSTMPRENRFSAISAVEAYWKEIRASRPVPFRSEVDPRRIEDALEYAFILERIAPGIARFRLAGMHLSDLMGMEVRGMPLTAMFMPEARRPVSDTLERVFSGPAAATLTMAGQRGTGRPPLDARLILLPLRSDMGDITRVLGCLVSEGPIGRAPRRFELRQTQISPIVIRDDDGERTGESPRAGSRGVVRRSESDPTPEGRGGNGVRGMAERFTPYRRSEPLRRPDVPTGATCVKRDGRPSLYVVEGGAD